MKLPHLASKYTEQPSDKPGYSHEFELEPTQPVRMANSKIMSGRSQSIRDDASNLSKFRRRSKRDPMLGNSHLSDVTDEDSDGMESLNRLADSMFTAKPNQNNYRNAAKRRII